MCVARTAPAAESMYKGKSCILHDSRLICLHPWGKALSEIQLAADCSADAALVLRVCANQRERSHVLRSHR